jgi:antitoxin HigA-1
MPNMPEYPARRPSRMEPAHPGAILRDDVLPALGVTVTEAARQLGVSRQALHAVLAERAAVSPEMAVRLGRFCGNGPEIWLRMQTAHDLWHAERRLGQEIEKIPRYTAT